MSLSGGKLPTLIYIQHVVALISTAHTHKASKEEREKVVLHTHTHRHTIIVPNTPKMAVFLWAAMKGPKFK